MGKLLKRETTALDGVTSTTTSDPIDVAGMGRISVQILAANITSGNGEFEVEGTIDGTNWATINVMIDNVTSTNTQQLTRISSKTLNADGSDFMFLDNIAGLKAIRVKVTRTTDGTYSAFVLAEG